MGALIRAHDWSRTPLGPITLWPQSLRTAIDIMLNSRYAMFVWWGHDLTNLYNDAYRPFLGTKHPRALGRELDFGLGGGRPDAPVAPRTHCCGGELPRAARGQAGERSAAAAAAQQSRTWNAIDLACRKKGTMALRIARNARRCMTGRA
jgi:hypothetical protein